MKKLMMIALCALAANVAVAKESPDYLSFTATGGDVTIGMVWTDFVAGTPTAYHTFEWSADKAIWTEFLTGSSNMTVHAGETVYFRRKGEEKVTTLNPNSTSGGWQFTMTHKDEDATIAAGGNVMSLLDASCEQTEVGASAFSALFCGCTALTAAPELPAEMLAEGCYRYMFMNCTSLTAAPELPATTLEMACYNSMFSGCTALTAAPELPATTLAGGCYYSMFSGCTALGRIKVGFTAWAGGFMTREWVKGVAASGHFICPSELDDQWGSDYIPSGWTKVDADALRFVIVPKVEHLKTAVTTNGSAVTAMDSADSSRWMVAKGAAVQVEFSADKGWGVEGTKSYSIDSLTDDVIFGTTEGYPLPEVIEVPIGKWTVGEDARATLHGSGDLEITGTGAMYDFASAEDVPWAAFVDEVTTVTIEEGVTHVGKNAFAGFKDAVTVNGTPLSVYDMMAGARGLSEPVIPDNMVLVTKESIQAAKAETVQIANGQIELGVSVLSNSDITAEAPWAPVKFTEGTQIGLSADGTKLVIPVPVTAQQGFMILQSGDAKVQADELKLSGGKVFTGDY